MALNKWLSLTTIRDTSSSVKILALSFNKALPQTLTVPALTILFNNVVYCERFDVTKSLNFSFIFESSKSNTPSKDNVEKK